MNKKRLGDILLESGIIDEQQLNIALAIQKEKKVKLGQVFIEENILSEDQIFKVLERQLGVPYIDLNNFYIDPKVPKIIPENIAKKHSILPIAINNGKLLIAMSDPLDIIAVDDVRLFSGMDVDISISTIDSIKRIMNNYYDGSDDAEKAVEEFNIGELNNAVEEVENESEDVASAPVVRLVNSIIIQASNQKASDIHVEPFEKEVRIRYRVDGELKEIMNPSKAMHSSIVTRIKIMGKMDIAEKRIPQDGRVEMNIEGRMLDLRISVLPTIYGEKVVIRLLDRNAIVVSKEQLGFTEYNLDLFDRIIKAPEGIILLTGPTGSGKTTTLYTILKELNSINKNIITLEDPVEYRLAGVNQVQVNAKAGLNFASGLRSILRQDPDIVMVGEIRDAETVEIAVRASITGHLVLSTLHTNDTAATISRLIDMGVENYMVSSSVVGIIAQRLVKRICPRCKEEVAMTDKEMKMLKLDAPIPLYKGKGCQYCSKTGYSGRIAIHEIMVMDREIRSMIDNQESIDAIKQRAIEKGMKTLNQTCVDLVKSGVTTIDEMVKITYSIDL